MDTRVLKEIGLSDTEIKVYLSLLKNGPCLASKIALDAGINRTLTYDRIQKLMEKGIASYAIRENRKYFTVISPKNLLNYIEEKKRLLDLSKDELNRIMPALESMKKSSEGVVIEVFKGNEGVKTLLNQVIETGGRMRVFPVSGAFIEKIPIFYRNYLNRSEKAGIRRQLLVSEDKKDFSIVKTRLTEVRYLPKEFNVPSSTWTYGDYTVIFIAAEEFTMIRIKSKVCSDMQNNFFESLWKIAKK